MMHVAAWYHTPTTTVRDICCRKFVLPEQVDHSSPTSLKICYAPLPLTVPNFIALGQMTWEKSVTKFFFTPWSILAPQGNPLGQSSPIMVLMYSKTRTTNVPNLVPFWQPVYKICCWTSMISLKSDQQTDKKPKRYVFAYRAATTIQQVVKVIWHKAASLPQTDSSNVYARWRQCALPWEQIGATWWIRWNMCFLRPTRVHNLNDKSISTAIFAQLTAESPYTLQWAPLSRKITPSHRGIWTPSYTIPWAHPSP